MRIQATCKRTRVLVATHRRKVCTLRQRHHPRPAEPRGLAQPISQRQLLPPHPLAEVAVGLGLGLDHRRGKLVQFFSRRVLHEEVTTTHEESVPERWLLQPSPRDRRRLHRHHPRQLSRRGPPLARLIPADPDAERAGEHRGIAQRLADEVVVPGAVESCPAYLYMDHP